MRYLSSKDLEESLSVIDPRSLNSTYKNPNKQNRESAVRIAQGACTVHESSATFDKNPSNRSKSSESWKLQTITL